MEVYKDFNVVLKDLIQKKQAVIGTNTTLSLCLLWNAVGNSF